MTIEGNYEATGRGYDQAKQDHEAGHVLTAKNSLFEQIEMLTKTIADLEDRLANVLRPDREATVLAAIKETADGPSAIGAELYELTSRVVSARRRLDGLIQRLDL